jgi:hypothetical protein
MKTGQTLVLLAFLLAATSASAQSFYHKENSLYLELFGSGGELSGNYEKIIDQKVSVRVGAGLTGVAFRKGFVVPFGISYLKGANQNYLEVGVGGAYVDIDDKETESTYLNVAEDQVVGTALIGYRYLGDYGYTFRLAFTPALTKDGFEPMGGAIFGWAF